MKLRCNQLSDAVAYNLSRRRLPMIVTGMILLSSALSAAQDGNDLHGVGSVRGSVYRADTGKPARFASVTLHKVQGIGATTGNHVHPEEVDRVTMTDLNGEFFLSDVLPGEYELLTWSNGYQSPLSGVASIGSTGGDLHLLEEKIKAVLVTVIVNPGMTTRTTCYLRPGSEIAGRVAFDDGSPAVGFFIDAYRKKDEVIDRVLMGISATISSPVVTDERGKYRLVGLPPGLYFIKATAPTVAMGARGILSGSVQADIEKTLSGTLSVYTGSVVRAKEASSVEAGDGDTVVAPEIVINLLKLHQVDGYLMKAEEKVSRGFLELQFQDDHGLAQRTHILPDGSFHLNFVYSGDYILKITTYEDVNGVKDRAKTTTLTLHIDKDLYLPVDIP